MKSSFLILRAHPLPTQLYFFFNCFFFFFFPQRLDNIRINGFVTVSAQVFSTENRVKASWPQCVRLLHEVPERRDTPRQCLNGAGSGWTSDREGFRTLLKMWHALFPKTKPPHDGHGKLLNLDIVRDVKQLQEITENTVFSYL